MSGRCSQPDGGSWSSGWGAPTRGETNGEPSSAASGGLASSLAAAGPAGDVASCAAATHAPLRLGSWNIQNFGNAKTGRPAVMAAIGGIAARYDVLSVQELSQVPTNPGSCSVDGETGTAACSLLDALNGAAAPRTFELAASPRACTFDSCGDATTYNEQYMIVWDSSKLELVGSAVYPDPSGVYERDPWAAHLRETASGVEFAVLAIHTPPSRAEEEVLAMGDVLEWAATTLCDNVLLVGDYNADGSYANEDTVWPTLFGAEYGTGTLGDAFEQVVDNSVDTTVAASSNTYDRVIVSTSLQSASVAAGGGTGAVFAVRSSVYSILAVDRCLGPCSSDLTDLTDSNSLAA